MIYVYIYIFNFGVFVLPFRYFSSQRRIIYANTMSIVAILFGLGEGGGLMQFYCSHLVGEGGGLIQCLL